MNSTQPVSNLSQIHPPSFIIMDIMEEEPDFYVEPETPLEIFKEEVKDWEKDK